MSSQEASGGKFLPVFFVDEVKEGAQFQAGEWPLHMTLFPPLETSYDAPLGKAIRYFVNPVEPFNAVVGKSDIFGTQEMIDSGKGVFVRKIEENPSLRKVHGGLVQALAHLRHNPTFRTPYNPHVSMDPINQRLHEGSDIWVEGMSLVTREPGAKVWKVVDKMRFKGEAR